jgi:hypothetical protein
LVSQFSLGFNHTLILNQKEELYQTVPPSVTHRPITEISFQQITLRSSHLAKEPSFIKIGARGTFSAVLLDETRHFLVWSTVNLRTPVLVLGGDEQPLLVDDFQMSDTQGVLKVSMADAQDLLYTFNFDQKSLALFEDIEPGLQMVSCGSNSLLGLVKTQKKVLGRRRKSQSGSRSISEERVPTKQTTNHHKSRSQVNITAIKGILKQDSQHQEAPLTHRESRDRTPRRESTSKSLGKRSNNSDIKHLGSNFKTSPVKHLASTQHTNPDAHSLSQHTSKSKRLLKDALLKEITQRQCLERQLVSLQQDFETFRKDLAPVSDYNRLYEACLKECAKTQRYHRLYQESEARLACVQAETA